MVLLAVTRREHNHEENNDSVDGHRHCLGGGCRTGLVVSTNNKACRSLYYL